MLILAVCVMIFTNYTLLLLASVVCVFIILQFARLTNQKHRQSPLFLLC